MRAIPANLVTCLPAQAVACRLAGTLPNAAKKGGENDKDAAAGIVLFEELVKDVKFRVRVESVSKDGVSLVQASTLDRPAVNINRRLAEAVTKALPQQQQRSAQSGSSKEPVEVVITHFASTNSFFGQPR